MKAFTSKPQSFAIGLALVAALSVTGLAQGGRNGDDFPGQVRLVLPKVIYAVPGVETNIYFDNVVLVVNPANYIFDVTCDRGFQYDDRWTYTPDAEDIGHHPIKIEVRNEANAVIARARSTVRVARPQAGGDRTFTFLAIGDSHLQKDVYMHQILDLSKVDSHFKVTLIGSRGKGNKPPSDDLRHEGYNGWTAEAFVTRVRPKPRTGNYVPARPAVRSSMSVAMVKRDLILNSIPKSSIRAGPSIS